ncbi:hypothetical protein [Alkalicoccobacillus gibsonii]|uniref:hypothetical protein n=1 Tax=Alkalicoccobacillus gibsonii TaxID=79881 RepID=UPI0019347F81|nr:hypothetical protein [Alkalicoccobacillus gibsonii]MBM0064763.1 hypothetical protein [Alkalicoccobacillus gibsonii]
MNKETLSALIEELKENCFAMSDEDEEKAKKLFNEFIKAVGAYILLSNKVGSMVNKLESKLIDYEQDIDTLTMFANNYIDEIDGYQKILLGYANTLDRSEKDKLVGYLKNIYGNGYVDSDLTKKIIKVLNGETEFNLVEDIYV